MGTDKLLIVGGEDAMAALYINTANIFSVNLIAYIHVLFQLL